MKLLTHLKIAHRLAFAFGTLVLLVALISLIGITRLDAVDDDLEIILHDRFAKVSLVQQVENEINRQSRALSTALLSAEPAGVAAQLQELEASASRVGKAVTRLEETVHSAEGKSALAALEHARVAFKEREHALVERIRAGRLDEARATLVRELLPRQNDYLDAVEALVKTQVDAMEKFGADADATVQRARLLLLGLGVLASVIAVVVGATLTRSITRPLGEAVRVAGAVAAGNLTERVHSTRQDECGALLRSMQAMNENLSAIVGQVRRSSDSIATGSTQIASGNADLSHRTEEQASSLQQAAASMEQMNSAVQQHAETARQATTLAGTASEAARRGGEIVAQVVGTMDEISQSSRRISDITGTIDGIAFQTNILALNAAVEAARAGEQGRGFAVVAGEVRALAQRSASAAREIKALITASAEKVNSGTRLVGDAGASMDDILAQVKRMSDLIAEMSTATIEQTQGIGQVTGAVQLLDEVTQRNAALVEESAAAAESLRTQAAQLLQAVNAFRLEPA